MPHEPSNRRGSSSRRLAPAPEVLGVLANEHALDESNALLSDRTFLVKVRGWVTVCNGV